MEEAYNDKILWNIFYLNKYLNCIKRKQSHSKCIEEIKDERNKLINSLKM
jgi:hypothetical protein